LLISDFGFIVAPVIVALLAASLSLSHAWIVVPTGAPQRALLEKAGFRIDPTVNRHDGQGTASISVEFENGFLELLYPDPSVAISPANKAGAEKFRLKSEWRTNGYSPIGIVFDRTPSTPATLPFPTWKITADWMEKGTFIEMMTPREMPKAVSLSISSHVNRPNVAAAHRLTAMRVVAPAADRLPPSASWIASQGLMKFDVGSEWLLDVTLDDGKQGITKDFQPDLPLILRY
jgi:hypothetical protein